MPNNEPNEQLQHKHISKVSSINRDDDSHLLTPLVNPSQITPEPNNPTSEFDDLHQMMINSRDQSGVPQRRNNGGAGAAATSMHNMSNNTSNNDVPFNDSAYRTGLTNNSNITSNGG